MLNDLFAGYPPGVALAVSLTIAALLAATAAQFAGRFVRVALTRLAGDTDTDQLVAIRSSVRGVRVATFLLILAVLVVPAAEFAGYRMRFGAHREAIIEWLFAEGLRIALIIVLAWLVVRSVRAAVQRLELEVGRGTGPDAIERAKRVRTVGNLTRNVIGILIAGSASLMILRELHVDIMPLLTGAGILGLAISFGAQTLVKDVISGFFLIVDNQVRVGDVATINGTGGLVEAINLRTIVLRDVEGTVHVFPNGAITTLANRTKDFSYAVVDLTTAYREDPDRVASVITAVGAELQQDPKFRPSMIEPIEVTGIESFGESSMMLRARVKTLPQKQWEVARELRKRVKRAFDAAGIEIPQRTVTVVSPDPRLTAPAPADVARADD